MSASGTGRGTTTGEDADTLRFGFATDLRWSGAPAPASACRVAAGGGRAAAVGIATYDRRVRGTGSALVPEPHAPAGIPPPNTFATIRSKDPWLNGFSTRGVARRWSGMTPPS